MGAPKGNTNAWKHGIYACKSSYYKKLPNDQKEWIDTVVESFLEDAPFDREHEGKVELLYQVAIDMHKRNRANDYIYQEGLTQTETSDYHSEFGAIKETKENVLNMTADRFQRTNMRILKDLGVLDDPDSQKAEAGKTLIDVLSSVDTDE